MGYLAEAQDFFDEGEEDLYDEDEDEFFEDGDDFYDEESAPDKGHFVNRKEYFSRKQALNPTSPSSKRKELADLRPFEEEDPSYQEYQSPELYRRGRRESKDSDSGKILPLNSLEFLHQNERNFPLTQELSAKPKVLL